MTTVILARCVRETDTRPAITCWKVRMGEMSGDEYSPDEQIVLGGLDKSFRPAYYLVLIRPGLNQTRIIEYTDDRFEEFRNILPVYEVDITTCPYWDDSQAVLHDFLRSLFHSMPVVIQNTAGESFIPNTLRSSTSLWDE